MDYLQENNFLVKCYQKYIHSSIQKSFVHISVCVCVYVMSCSSIIPSIKQLFLMSCLEVECDIDKFILRLLFVALTSPNIHNLILVLNTQGPLLLTWETSYVLEYAPFT